MANEPDIVHGRKQQRAVWRVAGALWRASVGRWAEREFAVLAALALAAAALWGFVELAGEVLEGETHAFDERILLACAAPPTAPIRSGRAGSRS